MTSPTQITSNQLARLIGTPDRQMLIDLRIDEDFADDPRMIPGATRHAYTDLNGLERRVTGRKCVIYCQKGLKGAAAILRCHGIDAETLEGGQFAWRDAELPMINAAKLPDRHAAGQTVWVTRHRPKIDRIACPWLIRRFVDPNAQILFVAPGQVGLVAEKFNATPFDVDDTVWSHRGDACTFDTMIDEFDLHLDALDRMAQIIRGADTDRLDLAPECAGLLALSLGLSRMYRDDLVQLDAGMLIYDALYRWARDATAEGHDCAPPRHSA